MRTAISAAAMLASAGVARAQDRPSVSLPRGEVRALMAFCPEVGDTSAATMGETATTACFVWRCSGGQAYTCLVGADGVVCSQRSRAHRTRQWSRNVRTADICPSLRAPSTQSGTGNARTGSRLLVRPKQSSTRTVTLLRNGNWWAHEQHHQCTRRAPRTWRAGARLVGRAGAGASADIFRSRASDGNAKAP